MALWEWRCGQYRSHAENNYFSNFIVEEIIAYIRSRLKPNEPLIIFISNNVNG